MIREIAKMLNQYAVDNPTLSINLSFPPHPDPVECLAVLWECRAATMGRQTLGTRMAYRETLSSSAPYPQESNLWVSNVSEHTSPHVMSESQTPSSRSEMPVKTANQKFIRPQ